MKCAPKLPLRLTRYFVTAACGVFLFFSSLASASVRDFFTYDEFRGVVQEVALKTNLFRDIWEKNPDTQFTGGTVRDLILWTSKQFAECKTRECVDLKLKHLRSLPMIDIRSFILEESDVDLIGSMPTLNPKDYAVRKFDSISGDFARAGTPESIDALAQGYVASERMILTQTKIDSPPAFGDGFLELFQEKLSVHFGTPEEFWKTSYAKARENHPILLILRYLRTVSLFYNSKHPDRLEQPDLHELLALIPEETQKQILKITESSIDDKKLIECSKNQRFMSFLTTTNLKSYRAYTNPTATYLLQTHFGVDRVIQRIPEAPTINQFLFAEPRRASDLELFKSRIEEFGFREEEILEPVEKFFPNLTLYHGTKNETAFQDILRRGILPSYGGSAGAGLYGTNENSKEFAEAWGGDPLRLVEFKIDSKTRYVSFKNRKLIQLKEAYEKKLSGKIPKSLKTTDPEWEAFFKYFGIDLYRYDYENTQAVVVKNSGILSKPKGVYRQVLTLTELVEMAETIPDPATLKVFLNNFKLNEGGLNKIETQALINRVFHSYPGGTEAVFREWVSSDIDLPLIFQEVLHKKMGITPLSVELRDLYVKKLLRCFDLMTSLKDSRYFLVRELKYLSENPQFLGKEFETILSYKRPVLDLFQSLMKKNYTSAPSNWVFDLWYFVFDEKEFQNRLGKKSYVDWVGSLLENVFNDYILEPLDSEPDRRWTRTFTNDEFTRDSARIALYRNLYSAFIESSVKSPQLSMNLDALKSAYQAGRLLNPRNELNATLRKYNGLRTLLRESLARISDHAMYIKCMNLWAPIFEYILVNARYLVWHSHYSIGEDLIITGYIHAAVNLFVLQNIIFDYGISPLRKAKRNREAIKTLINEISLDTQTTFKKLDDEIQEKFRPCTAELKP